MGSAAWRARAGVLMLVGALTVHELRYALVGGHEDAHAHGYMGSLVPLAGALLVLAAIEFSARLALSRRAEPRALAVGGMRWLAVGSMLLAIFAVQETAELLIAHGRLDVTDSLVVHGSWLGAPLSFAVGAVIALLLRGAQALLVAVSDRQRVPRARVRQARRPLPARTQPRVAVIACHLAGRAPPSFVN